MEQIVLEVEFPAELIAVSQARRQVSQVALELGCSRVDDMALVVSELVANAVEHSGGPVTVSAIRAAHHLRVDVHDMSSDAPRVEAVDADAERGRGMQIVSSLAAQWGVVERSAGKSVWAEFPC